MPPKFVPRERKHKRLEKLKPASNSATTSDANADIVLPTSAAEREERRRKLQEELRAQQPQAKVSGKKRKRLEHYIDTKLRKEENQELIKKLANQHVDTSLYQSSKKLGRVNESKREGLERALKERERGIDVRGDHDEILFEKRKIVDQPAHQSEDDDEEDESEDEVNTKAVVASQPSAATAQSNGVGSGGLFGGGLKRPLEVGEDGRPIIKKRKRVKRAKRNNFRASSAVDDEDEDMEGASDGPSEGHSDSEESDFRGFDSESEEVEKEQDSESEAESSNGDSEDEEEESSEEEEEDEDKEDAETRRAAKKEKSSAFKLWATEQRHDALGFQPSTAPIDDAVIRAAFKPRAHSPDPVAQALTSVPTNVTARPKSAITIPRSEEIQKVRMELPVVQEEQRIMEAIHNNPVVVVCGATGSGKTTQVPQMMYESGYGALIGNKSEDASKPSLGRGMIGITQPRRVAAVSVADRVATEVGDEFKNRVGHQVRYDTTASRETAMKFMTDGILLREIGQDFILSKYSAIVVDEAHERSVNTDILIGMLSRIVNLRDELTKEEPEKYYPLKLVIMSATLRVSDFMQNQRLFRNGAPPIVEAEGRQYPVTVHFSRKTQRDYVDEMVKKVARGHKKLPHGSILVFLTGQNEIETVAKRLKDTLGCNTAGYGKMLKARESADQMPLELDDMEESSQRKPNDTLEGEDSDDSDTEFQGIDDDAEDAEFEVEDDVGGPRGALKPHVLPLYASLPTIQQMRVFQPPPDGSRMIVLATNVAETSLTIPGVRYVFDCGRSKEKKYDTTTGVQTFEIDWVSKASASQRSGRAGRTGPGHCYRLYSSAVFENYFAEHGIPEVLRTPLESTVLQLKAMEIDHVVNFPFPTPPDRSQLATAEKLLSNLGAIDAKSGRITDTGKELIKHPVSPRFGKMLLLALRNNLVAPTIATVAALAVGDLIVPQAQFSSDKSKGKDDADSDVEYDSDPESRAFTRQEASAALTASQQRHQAYGRAQATLSRWDDLSDSIKMLTAVAAHADAASKQTATTFCADFFLREKAMQEVQQLRAQLHNIVRSTQRSAALSKSLAWQPTVALPSERERKQLNQIVASGFIDNLAIRNDLLPNASPSMLRKPRRSIEVAYTTLFPSVESVDRKATPEQQEMQRSVFVHAASVLARRSVAEMPAYIVYSHLSRAAASSVADTDVKKMPRTRMHPLTALSAKEVAALAEGTPLLELGKPIGKVEESEGGKKRVCWVGVEIKGPAGGAGAPWPMGAWKVRQSKGRKGEWVVDEILKR